MRRSQKLTRGDRGAGMSMMSSRTTTNSNSLMMNPALHQTWKSMYSSQHEPKIPYQNYTPRGDDAALSHNFVSPNNASPDAPSNKGSGRRRSSSGFGSMPPLNTDLIKNQIELMIVHNVPQGG